MKNGEYNLAIAPDEYPGRRYRGRYCPEHHLVWWRHTGNVPASNEVIHHKNGDKTDNRFENLEKMTRAEHASHHSDGTLTAVLRCPECGDVFERRVGATYLSDPNREPPTACSKSCGITFYHSDENRFKNVLWTYRK